MEQTPNQTLPKVLLVDDTREFHKNMEFVLENFQILSAFNEKEAIEFGEDNEFDLIILDLNLDINKDEFLGLELIDHFKKKTTDVPIVTVTGFHERETYLEEEALKRGAKRFLLKKDYNESWKEIFESYVNT